MDSIIKPVSVERVKGFWRHPELPKWELKTSREDVGKWADLNKISLVCVLMDKDATQEFIDSWYSDGLDDCSPWIPTSPARNAFLLSIHDHVDGPQAWFAIPQSML